MTQLHPEDIDTDIDIEKIHMVCEIENTDRAAVLFGDWQETMLWSCLQGVMGHIYADDAINPSSAMAILADYCFFAGQPESWFPLNRNGARRILS